MIESDQEEDVHLPPSPAPIFTGFASWPRQQIIASPFDPLFALRSILFPPGWFSEPNVEPIMTQSPPKTTKAAKKAARKALREQKRKDEAQSASIPVVASTSELAVNGHSNASLVHGSPGPGPVAEEQRAGEPALDRVVLSVISNSEPPSQRSSGSARKAKRVRSKKSSQSATEPEASTSAIANAPNSVAGVVSTVGGEDGRQPKILVTSPPATNGHFGATEILEDDAEIDELEGSTQREREEAELAPQPDLPALEEEASDPERMEVDEPDNSTPRLSVEASPELNGDTEDVHDNTRGGSEKLQDQYQHSPSPASRVVDVLVPQPGSSVVAATTDRRTTSPQIPSLPHAPFQSNGASVSSPELGVQLSLPAAELSEPAVEAQEPEPAAPVQAFATIGSSRDDDSDDSSSEESSSSDESDDDVAPPAKKARKSIGALAAEAFGPSPAKSRRSNSSLPPSQLSQAVVSRDEDEDFNWLRSQTKTPRASLAKLLASDNEDDENDEEGSRSSRFSSVEVSDGEDRKTAAFQRPPEIDDESADDEPAAQLPDLAPDNVDATPRQASPTPPSAVSEVATATIEDVAISMEGESPAEQASNEIVSPLQAGSPPPELRVSVTPSSPPSDGSASTSNLHPTGLLSISELPISQEAPEEVSFSSQPLDSSQYDDPLFPESQFVPLIKDTPLFFESQATQETQGAAVSSSVADERGWKIISRFDSFEADSPLCTALDLPTSAQAIQPSSPELPATQVASENETDMPPPQSPVALRSEVDEVDRNDVATPTADHPATPNVRHSARLTTRSPSPGSSQQHATASDIPEDTHDDLKADTTDETTSSLKKSKAKSKAASTDTGTPIAAPQRRSLRASSAQPLGTPVRGTPRARGASQDSILKKALPVPTSSSRPVRASRMLSLSQIDEKATRTTTPRSSQVSTSHPAGSTRGAKKSWLAAGDGDDDSDDEPTPQKGKSASQKGKSIWG
ncbi:hypothetical protein P7C70_g1444, partial [Phenoliferia sp. Uapishka_3]